MPLRVTIGGDLAIQEAGCKIRVSRRELSLNLVDLSIGESLADDLSDSGGK